MTTTLEIPIHRLGERQPYRSMDTVPIESIYGEDLGSASIAIPARLQADITPKLSNRLMGDIRDFGLPEMIAGLSQAAEHFLTAELNIGGLTLGPNLYCEIQSKVTGTTVRDCKEALQKIYRAMKNAEAILRGHLEAWREDLTLEELFEGAEGDGYGLDSPLFGAILPSNSAGVHQVWAPLLALVPSLLKPGSGDLFSPLRIRAACEMAGMPVEAIGYYPGKGAALSPAISKLAQHRMIFGNAQTVAAHRGNPAVDVHGPGFSKMALGFDKMDAWESYIEIMAESVVTNHGKGCIACSAIYAPRPIARLLADRLAQRIGDIAPMDLRDEAAILHAYGSESSAGAIFKGICDFGDNGGFEHITDKSNRVVSQDGVSFLRPVILFKDTPEPGDFAASVFEFSAPAVIVQGYDEGDDLVEITGDSLVMTAITDDQSLLDRLEAGNVSRLNREPVPTIQIHGNPKFANRPLEGDGLGKVLYWRPSHQTVASGYRLRV